MSISFRSAGVAAGAALLVSAATASGALAANPIRVSLVGSTLTIDDPTGVGQAETISTAGSGFDITEANSANVLQAGPGITAAVQYSPTHWVVVSNGPAITGIAVNGNAGADGVSAAGVTNVPVNLQGDDGNDFLTGGSLADTINGGNGTDTVNGGSGNDLLSGGPGADSVYGNDGDDSIYDKDGATDYVDGGNGLDTFTRDAFDNSTNIEVFH